MTNLKTKQYPTTPTATNHDMAALSILKSLLPSTKGKIQVLPQPGSFAVMIKKVSSHD